MHSLNRLISSIVLSGACLALPPAQAAWPFAVDGQTLPSLAPMLKKAMPAVVNISTKTKIEMAEHPLMRDPFFRHFFEIPNAPRHRESSSLGSGVIVDARKGHILTNNHVIDKADEILVTLHDGRPLKAKLVGTDPESDIAVIQVEAKDLTELNVADSSQLQVGDFVVAIGNPFGLGQTVTSGIISALGRSGLGIEGYEDFIQTDASINPGNSGGALVNLKGELIGINTAILAPSGGNVGIGFAIPSNMADNIKTRLLEHGEIRRGLLGVNVQDLTPELAQAFGLDQTHGAVITGVQPGGSADKAGFEAGDILLSINDQKIRSGTDVRNRVGLLGVGESVEIEVLRKGETLRKKAVIAAPKLSREEGKHIHVKLSGLLLSNPPPADNISGVRVERINTASAAFQAGLRPGDLIVGANRKEVSDLDSLKSAVAGKNELLLNIEREDSSFFVILR
jgi:serine protease Do/serine protease DegQ